MGKIDYTKHHIIPTSRGGTNHYNNLINLRESQHRGLHSLFANMTPREQLERLIEIQSKALSFEVHSDLIHILEVKDLQYWYKPNIYKNCRS